MKWPYSKGCKPDNFASFNSQKLRFTNNWGLHLIFVECESFLESNPADILALYETNSDYSIDSGNFTVPDYLPFNVLAVYVKEGFPFAQELFPEKSSYFDFCLQLALPYLVFYFFFLYWS